MVCKGSSPVWGRRGEVTPRSSPSCTSLSSTAPAHRDTHNQVQQLAYPSQHSNYNILCTAFKDWISFWVHLLDHERNGQTGKSMKRSQHSNYNILCTAFKLKIVTKFTIIFWIWVLWMQFTWKKTAASVLLKLFLKPFIIITNEVSGRKCLKVTTHYSSTGCQWAAGIECDRTLSKRFSTVFSHTWANMDRLQTQGTQC